MLGLGFLCVPRGGLVRAPGAFDQMWTLVNVELSTVSTFKKVTLESTGTDAVITAIAGTTYSKNGGAYTAAAGVISDEDTLAVRITSSAEYETAVLGGVIIGGVSCAASATTVAEAVGFPYTFPFVLG